MSEPQLERSVLEAKEREELYAIADALGTKPGRRAKKADLITQILRATGVETGAPRAGREAEADPGQEGRGSGRRRRRRGRPTRGSARGQCSGRAAGAGRDPSSDPSAGDGARGSG